MLKDIIRKLRETHHLTQEDVAEYLNIRRTTYTRYETGTNTLNFEALCRLADLYQVSTDFLLERNKPVDTAFLPELITLYNNSETVFKDIALDVLRRGQKREIACRMKKKEGISHTKARKLPLVKLEGAFWDSGSSGEPQSDPEDFVVAVADDSMQLSLIHI